MVQLHMARRSSCEFDSLIVQTSIISKVENVKISKQVLLTILNINITIYIYIKTF